MGITRRGLTEDLVPHVESTIGITGLKVAFQPIVEVATKRVFAYEALLRSTDVRFVGPPALIEETIAKNVCGELGRITRGLAIAECRNSALFLNVHPKEFEDGWVVRPDDPIFQHEHPVYLEITESVPLSHESYCRGTLSEIRDKGIRLAVDDLGAGFSNLLYIAQLQPDIVKLDRELTRAVADDERSQRLVEGVVKLCTDMGAQVVAEGVETVAELRGVVEAGVTFVQGFLIGYPVLEPEVPIDLPW